MELVKIITLTILSLTFSCGHPKYTSNGLESASLQWWVNDYHLPEDPTIEPTTSNHTVTTGDTVRLPCIVRSLSDKRVSWIRARDLTVIAVDLLTVTSDPRFQVDHTKDTDEWTLVIEKVKPQDQGTYDCQINTHPKTSYPFHLIVHPDSIESSHFIPGDTSIPPGTQSDQPPIAITISGHPWLHVQSGATMAVLCQATGKGLVPPLEDVFYPKKDRFLITWYLDDVPVGVLFEENKFEISEMWSEATVKSKLLVLRANHDDAGSYTCGVRNTKSPAVSVAVLDGHTKGQYYSGQPKSEPQMRSVRDHVQPTDSPGRGPIITVSGILLVLLFLFHVILCLVSRRHH